MDEVRLMEKGLAEKYVVYVPNVVAEGDKVDDRTEIEECTVAAKV